MSSGGARHSQLTIVFSALGKQGETSNQRSFKWAKEEIEDTNPTVIITQASTATITNETVNQNLNCLTVPNLGQ